MVTRTRLNVTLYAHYLSCWMVKWKTPLFFRNVAPPLWVI